MSVSLNPVWDFIIIGAGPAGTAAALSALQVNNKASVLLVDKKPPGRDKTCGDGIGPDAVDILDMLDATAHVIRKEESIHDFQLGIVDGAHHTGRVKTPGYVIPRTIFDERLLRLARERGANFQQASCIDVEQNLGNVTATLHMENGERQKHTGRVLVAADGAYSPIRRSLGIPANTGRHMSIAIRGYTPVPDGFPHSLHITWDREGKGNGISYMWAFPMHTGIMNIGYGTTLAEGAVPKNYLHDRLTVLLQKDGIGVDVDSVKLVGHQLPLSSSLPVLAHHRVLLVGDAASLVNPLSGEGIVYALLSGRLAGRTLPSTSPGQKYMKDMRQALHRHHRQVRFLARVTHPYLVETVIKTLERNPDYLERVLSVSVGTGTMTPKGIASFLYHGSRNFPF